MGQSNFYFSTANQPHQQRAVEILRKYPQIKNLIGRNPNTFFILLFLVASQVAIAAWLGRLGFEQYWWLSLLVAYFVGAFLTHPLYAIIHEATHNLIFKNRLANRLCLILADLPTETRVQNVAVALTKLVDLTPQTIGVIECQTGALQQSRDVLLYMPKVLNCSGDGLVVYVMVLNT